MVAMTVHVCGSDGQPIGEFEELLFRDKVTAGELRSDHYYWHEGMTDWRPVSDYHALAKTQRISFAPPMTSTVKINVDSTPQPPSKPQTAVSRLWARLTRARY